MYKLGQGYQTDFAYTMMKEQKQEPGENPHKTIKHYQF